MSPTTPSYCILALFLTMHMKELFGLFLRPLSRFQIRLKSNLSMKTTDILALDFDGVVCASSPESSYSSIVAAKQVWPSSFTNVEIADPTSYSSLQEVIMYLRPIIETGYENMLIARYLHESKRKGSDVELEWNPSFRDQLISNYGIPKNELIDIFGRTRDELIAIDLPSWISKNKIYSEVLSSLQSLNMHSNPNTYIVSTKQGRFVEAILRANEVSVPPPERIFDLENKFGPKQKVLEALTDMHREGDNSSSELRVHFVEDRYETLLGIAENRKLDHVALYLVDWGYNTAQQRAEAAKHSRIKLIDASEFTSLLKTMTTT